MRYTWSGTGQSTRIALEETLGDALGLLLDETPRLALGETLGDALGLALGEALGNELGDALGLALGPKSVSIGAHAPGRATARQHYRQHSFSSALRNIQSSSLIH